MVAWSEINLREQSGSNKLIKQKIDLRKGVLVLNCNFIEGPIIHTHLQSLILLLYENGLIAPRWRTWPNKTFSNKASIWVFHYASSFGGIQYDLLEMEVVPGFNSITNSTSLSRGNPGKSSRNTSRNSCTTRISCSSFTTTSKTLSFDLARAGTWIRNLASPRSSFN